MSQQLNETGSENQKGAGSTSGRTVRRVLGAFLWTSALVMGYFVWQASRQLRETMNARAQAAASQIPADGTAAPTATGASKNPPTTSLWDQSGIQDFTFTERSGRKVTKADLLGHPWLISFIFTRCAGPCPRVSGRMSDLQRLLAGTDVRLVTLTVDPDFDKPDVLNRYAQVVRRRLESLAVPDRRQRKDLPADQRELQNAGQGNDRSRSGARIRSAAFGQHSARERERGRRCEVQRARRRRHCPSRARSRALH